MSDYILQERDGAILRITLNDPERANPLSPAMVHGLARALRAAEDDPSVRALILSGAGRHFSAGADLAALQQVAAGGDEEANLEDSRRLGAVYAQLLDHSKLTMAAVHGAAVAGGCGLASACDFVVAERSARLAYPEVKIGFIPAMVSTFLTRRVSGHVARRLLLDPEMLGADQAHALGLVDEVVDDGSAVEKATEWAESILHRASPAALAATKRLLNATVGMPWREALDAAAEANVEQRMHAECRRGVKTFLDEKRTPDWLREREDCEK